MSRSTFQSFLAAIAVAALISTPAAQTTSPSSSSRQQTTTPADGRASAIRQAYLRTPLRFEPRRAGDRQASEFVARGVGYAVSLSGGDAMVTLGARERTPVTIAMRLAGARGGAAGSGRRELPGRSSRIFGADPRRWERDIRSFGEVEYREVYPGIDLLYYGNQRQLEYDFVVHPGASPREIAFHITGARDLSLDADGNLVMTTEAGALTHRAPVMYQDVEGSRRPVQGRYALAHGGRVTFEVGAYDTALPLVIDPVLSYATYLGGSNEERVHAVAVDSAGNAVVAGETYSSDFPVAAAGQPQYRNFGDAFVAKLTPAGDALVFATYIGGSAQDAATGVDVDASGAVYVAGSTFSWDFPTLNGFQSANRGQSDTFVVKLDAGGTLAYATLVGGALEDYAAAISVDADGRAHITGSTASADFPTMNPIQPALGGSPVFRTVDGGATWTGAGSGLRTIGVRAFAIDPAAPDTIYAGTELEGVFKSTDAGATWLPASTMLSRVQVTGLAVVNGAAPAVFAATQSGTFRSLDGGSSWSQVLPGWGMAVVASPVAPSTIYAGLSTNGYPFGVFKSTDNGETWSDTGLLDGVSALAVSGSTVYAATASAVFTSLNGGTWTPANEGLPSQAIALVADATNPSIAYAATFDGLFKTVNGGASWTSIPMLSGLPIAALAISTTTPSTVMASVMWGGTVISTDSGDTWQPTASQGAAFTAIAFHPAVATTAYLGGTVNRDAFVATLAANGSALEFSTYFGGSDSDRATDIAVDGAGARYIVGETFSTDLPLANAVQTAHAGLQDAFAARFGPEGISWSTYLGGSGFESAPKVAVDAAGSAHVAGLTWSANYPVANAYQPQPGGGYSDVFVSVLNLSGSFAYSTYLGGAGAETDWSQSLGPDVAVTASGDTWVTGATMSLNFPASADAVQRTHAGGQNDAFITRFDAAGQLQYSTYLGGAGDDYGRGIAIGSQGDVLVAGTTSSANFPVHNAQQPSAAGSDEAFVARLTEGTAPSDTTAPATTIALSGTTGLNGWYRSAVVVTLAATDDPSGSGVAAVHYRLNGGAQQTYSGPFTVSAEGLTSLTVQAVDFAGNVETPAVASAIRIDTAAPAVGIASPQAREYLYSRTVGVSVSASETGSGLAAPVSVTIDGVPFGGAVIDLSTLSLGAHVLTASAQDIAGNASAASVTFQVVSVLDTTINVPAEAATIQAAIDRAENGDTVLVAPGTYLETLDFRGKAISVIGQAGPEQTIIDARGAGSVVTFKSGETRAALLSGFTIRGGVGAFAGGGVYIANSSPTVRGNVIADNRSCTGVGVYSTFGSPLIQGNRITRNTIVGCTGGWGIGIYIGGSSSAEIVGNEISDNTGAAASGGGIALFAAGNAVVRGNTIARNATSGAAGCGWGGGLISANFSQATVVNNLIVGNSACSGGGVYWGGTTGTNVFVNNTIADNSAVSWPGMYVSGFDARNQLHNNIITAVSGPALYCQNAPGVSAPTLISNDVFRPVGDTYGGTCLDQTGLNGNISANPGFLGPANNDYRVAMVSAVVDAGNDAAPGLPSTDLAGFERVFDGNGDGVAHVDMGAFESRNRAPVVFAGADQTISAGTDCLGRVTLQGTGTDPEGDPVRLTWSGSFGTASGTEVSLALPVGTHTITLTADDGIGGRASDTVVITVVDTTPPVISAISATPSVLTKSNHEMVPIVVSVSATDGCGGADCRIVSVASNEPGTDDWQITGPLTLNLRAERLGRGTGRIYTITVECRDAAGNVATTTVTVTVPK